MHNTRAHTQPGPAHHLPQLLVEPRRAADKRRVAARVVHAPVGREQQRALEDLDDLQGDVQADRDEVAQQDDEAQQRDEPRERRGRQLGVGAGRAQVPRAVDAGAACRSCFVFCCDRGGEPGE